jgi:hypothetical protein
MRGRILLIGLGDLGRRLAFGLAGSGRLSELIISGRRVEEGLPWAALIAACGETKVRFAELDVSRRSDIERLLRRERPNVVVQCASLLSPWYLSARQVPEITALRTAGFAAQLPAQLPLIYNLMDVARQIDFQGAVVNCSYPDVIHPILARLGLAPTIGIGNVSMIKARVTAVLRNEQEISDSSPLPLVRALAHHAHVTSAILSLPPADTKLRPRIYLGEEGRRADELAYAGHPLQSAPSLNALSATSGLPVIIAMLPGGPALRASAPGPLGLPGGYPLRIAEGQINLDLPAGLSLDEAVEFQHQSARIDGVETITEDGTVVFTEEAVAVLSRLDSRLGEPFHLSQSERRFKVLQSLLRS